MRLIDADMLEPDADYDDGEYWGYSIAQIESAPTVEPEHIYKRGYADGYHKAEKDYFERTAKDRGDAFKMGVEIILCSDCKHFVRNIPCVEGHYNGCDEWTDNGNEFMVAEDDFCSYAERREE